MASSKANLIKIWKYKGGGGIASPVITSVNSVNNSENSTLAHTLTANETVTWSLVGGLDQVRFELSGSTLRWASNGTKDYEAPNDSNTDNIYQVTVRATSTGTGLSTDQSISVVVLDASELNVPVTITPAAAWNGTAGSGFTAPYEAIPAAATETQERPSLHLLMPAWVTFAGSHVLVVTANCVTANKDDNAGEDFTSGVAGVDIYWEGNKATSTSKQFYNYTDANGNSQSVYGYAFELNGAAAVAMQATGATDVYFVARPSDPAKFPNRMGPYRFYPRNANALVEHTLHVDQSLAEIVGQRYNRVSRALAYVAAQHWQNTEVIVDNSGIEVWTAPTTSRSAADSVSWTTVRCAQGVDYRLVGTGVNGSSQTFNHNCLHLQGSGLYLDHAEGNWTVASSNARNWFDGIRIGATKPIFQQTYWFNPGYFLSPMYTATNTGQYMIFTENIYVNNRVGSNTQLHRNEDMTNITGDAFNNVHCIHGGYVGAFDGLSMRVHANNQAMLLTSPSGWKIAVSGAPNSASRTVTVYDASTVAQGTFALNGTVGSGNYTYMDLANWINTNFAANITATLQTPSGPGRGTELRALSIQSTQVVTSIPTSTFPITTIPTAGAGGLMCSAVVDAHADIIQNFLSGPGTNNCDYGFLRVDNPLGVQQIFLESISNATIPGGHKNLFIHHIEYIPDPANVSQAVWGGTVANSGWEYITWTASNVYIQTSANANFNPSPSTWIHHIYAGDQFTVVGTPDADIKLGNIFTNDSAVPSGSSHCKAGGSAAVTTHIVDPTGTPLVPVNGGPLLMDSGKYAGARKADGTWNGT